MKKIVVFMSALVIGQLAIAQVKENAPADSSMSQHRGHHKKHLHEKGAMMKELNLSEEQKTKLKEMNAGNKEKKQAILNDSKLTDEQKKEQLREIKKTQGENMRSILTDEQKTKMKEIKMKMKDRKRDRKELKTKTAGIESKGQEAPAPQNQ